MNKFKGLYLWLDRYLPVPTRVTFYHNQKTFIFMFVPLRKTAARAPTICAADAVIRDVQSTLVKHIIVLMQEGNIRFGAIKNGAENVEDTRYPGTVAEHDKYFSEAAQCPLPQKPNSNHLEEQCADAGESVRNKSRTVFNHVTGPSYDIESDQETAGDHENMKEKVTLNKEEEYQL